MKPIEHTEDEPRTVPFEPPQGTNVTGIPTVPPAKPRYIDLPPDPEPSPGPRNLACGIILIVVASVFYWMGLYLAGTAATRIMIASMGTFGLLWACYSLRVLRQKHGVLLAAGVVAFFGAIIPFVERGARKLDALARERLSDAPQKASAGEPIDKAERPVKTVEPRPAVAQKPAPAPVDDVVRELIVPEPDPTAGRTIRVKQDAQVVISGRKFLIRAGNQFPFKKFADGSVTFLAGEQEVTIDADLVTFTGQSKETPAEITKLAMAELKKRYPGVFEKGTPENDVFVARSKAIETELPDFFKNPRWPIELGEQLAEQEGWTRADTAPETTPASPLREAPEPANPPPVPN